VAIPEFLMRTIEIGLVALAILLLIPTGVLFLECIAAIFPGRRSRPLADRPEVDVLVPAHNEAPGIRPTLENLQAQLTPRDRVVVIADNCNDQTAEVASSTGVTVIERFDSVRRGKGYALDYGVRFLEADPPEVVVIMDADCVAEPGTIHRIAQMALTYNRPVQATYLLEQPAKPSPRDAISALAVTVKNLVRPLGMSRLGQPCLLTGTGMAFPWAVIRSASLASGNIVEDMNLALDLADAGHPTMFCADAQVTGVLPKQASAAKSQRTRWEHGHLQTIVTQVPRLLATAISKGRFDLFALALDLSIPPLSLLVMLWAGLMAIALVAYWLGTSILPVALLGIAGAMILTAIVLAWAAFCRKTIPATTLLAAPLYVLWKIPLYFKFLVKPQTKWVRTERDHPNSSK